MITHFAETDEDIFTILHGTELRASGTEYNFDAASKVEEFLEVQFNMNRNTTMDDVQKRYQAKPYGWREIDIAAVVAMLIQQQKVTIKYGGATIQPDNPKLVDMLRKDGNRQDDHLQAADAPGAGHPGSTGFPARLL